MRKVVILSFCFCCIVYAVIGQARNVRFHVKNLPVRDGVIYEPPDPMHRNGCGDFNDEGVTIESCKDSSFALADGTLLRVFDFEDYRALVVKGRNNTLISYSYILTTPFSSKDKGMTIKKGDFLGLLYAPFDAFELYLLITKRKRVLLSSGKVISFLQANRY